MPNASDIAVHRDNEAYRLCAIRETFEESGLLLAHPKTSSSSSPSSSSPLISLSESDRNLGRAQVHANSINFSQFLASHNAVPDLAGLIPLTRWITPPHLPKRFTTQMYVYFLPLSAPSSLAKGALPSDKIELPPVPTSDGGKEHVSAQFLPVTEWLRAAWDGEMIIFPPQIYLMKLLAPFFTHMLADGELGRAVLERQRADLTAFLTSGRWHDMVICPYMIKMTKEGKTVLALDRGGEAGETGSEGDAERVTVTKFSKEGPRKVEIRARSEVAML
jgi:hypothetical protein